MSSNHQIQKMMLHIDYDDSVRAGRNPKELVEWIKQGMLPRVESVLEELFSSPTPVVIDRLELDLGEWKLQDFQAGLPRCLENKLRSALLAYVDSREHKEHPDVQSCKEILERICTPLLPKAEEDAVRRLIAQVARIYQDGRGTVDLFDLSEKIIFELAKEFPGIQPRQLATIAYPKLKQVLARKDPKPTTAHATSVQGVSVENAGLVLAAPYLGHLFRMLELIVDGNFKDEAGAQHAAQLLRYAVYGDWEQAPQPKLLESILCGLPENSSAEHAEPVRADEKELVDQMLSSMIQHWQAIGSTSVQGLRDTFLRHNGWIKKEEKAWSLKVQNGPFDVLIDRLPWGFSMIKYDWMPQMLKVVWR